MSFAVVILKKGEGRMLKAGGAWIFDNEIAHVLGTYEDGENNSADSAAGYSADDR